MDTSACKYMGIRIFLKVLVLIFYTLLLSDCEDEKAHPREYPRLNTIPVSNITEKGATFNAEIISPGSEQIIEHGFVWGPNENLDFQDDNRISLGAIKNTGTFSAAITTTLEKGWKYSVKPFVKTADHMVYGAVVTFASLGSEAPQIIGFEPSSAGWMDTVKIKGRNFSWDATSNKVMFNQIECEVLSATDTTLIIRISTDLNALKSIISVDLAGNTAVHIKDTFRLIPPTLSDFYPKQAMWGDTLFLQGRDLKYFGSKSGNYFKLGTIPCRFLGYKNDSLLYFLVPYEITSLTSNLVMLINGFNLQGTQPFQLIIPEISDYYPNHAMWGDTLHIQGKHFKNISKMSWFFVKIGTISCSILGNENDSSVIATVPYELNTISSSLSLSMNGATSQSSKLFQLLTPGLTFNFDPKEATWGNNIIMSGNFNTIASRNSVFFDNVQATIVSTSSKELKIQVPAALSKIKTNIIYKATPFTMVATDTFRLKGPVINSFSPVSGPSNADITIKGKYFSSGNTTIKFGTTSGVITSMNDSTLIVKVPAGIHGPVKIIITVKLQSVTSSSDFIATNPKINSISPLSGTFNDEVTIEGEDFIPLSGNTTVTFGGIPATIKSINDTKAIVLVPLTLDSIPKTVVLTAGSISTSSPVVYTLASPVIISITPEESVPGLDVKITGVNFNPVTENNQVYLDGYPMVIKNGNANEIIATLPLGLARGDFKIKIITGGYSRFSAQKLRINSQWLKILTPQLLTTIQRRKNGMAIYGASLNGLGYFCSPASVMMYEFEPVNKTWTKMDLQTPYEYLQLMGQVVHKDKFYLIAGEQMGWEAFGINLLSFNKENGWQSRLLPAIMSDRGGVAFSLNNKIYFGLKWDIDNSEFWECDPNNNYTWLMKATCPAISSQFFSTYFSLAGKGYVLYHDRNLWEYDPVADSWTLKSQFPGQMRFEAISFVIGEFAYLGTGSENFNSKPYDDIWKYDPVSNSWTLVTHMPVARRSAVAITINNKAYIGYGIDGSDFDLYDFYEFDPNYPLK